VVQGIAKYLRGDVVDAEFQQEGLAIDTAFELVFDVGEIFPDESSEGLRAAARWHVLRTNYGAGSSQSNLAILGTSSSHVGPVRSRASASVYSMLFSQSERLKINATATFSPVD